jgi:flagellar assembly factor FliW
MKFASTRFGNLEVDDRTILTFPTGILGFPDRTKYVILDHDTEAPFKWLHCVEQADLAFVIIDPALFKPDYCVAPGQDALTEIEAARGQDLVIAVVLTIPSDDPGRVTANLRGPLVMNPDSRLCKQVVLSEDCPTRYPLFTLEQSTAPVLQNTAV